MVEQHFALDEPANQQPIGEYRDRIGEQVVANYSVLVGHRDKSVSHSDIEENCLTDVSNHQSKHESSGNYVNRDPEAQCSMK